MRIAVLLLAASCGSPPAPVAKAPPPVAIDVKPVPLPPLDDTQKKKADAAASSLFEKLKAVEATCRDKWMDPSAACTDPDFATIAADYQAEYGAHDDPAKDDKREDALWRLGGRDVPAGEVESRIRFACKHRCDNAERLAFAEAKEVAVEKCTTTAKKSECKTLAAHATADSPSTFENAVADCESTCDSRHRDLVAALAREANRPRTPAQSHACFRECMKSCTGGRVIPDANGNYNRDPDDWCGTCDVSCDSSCAVRP